MILIPSEVLTLYVAGKQMAPDYIEFWAVTCLLLVIPIRIWGTKDNNERKKIQWPSVIIALISFFLWVLAIGDSFPIIPDFDRQLIGLAILLWTTVTPMVYRGD
jgi:hypothetical protein